MSDDNIDFDSSIDETLQALTSPDGAGSLDGVGDVPANPGAVVGAEPVPEALKVPDSWRKETHELWSQLPRQIQEEVHRREGDMFKGIEQYKSNATLGERLQKILSPYEPIFNQYQIDPYHQIQNLLAAHYQLALGTPQQKSQLLQRLIQDYQIQLDGMPGSDSASSGEYVDPQVAALQSQLQELQSRFMSVEQARISAQQAELEKKVAAFAADPANEHFSTVYDTMVHLLRSKAATTLEDAYEKAVWLHPEAREKEISKQQKAQAERARLDALSKTKKAAAATAANVRTAEKTRGSAIPSVGSLDDTINEALENIRSRGH